MGAELHIEERQNFNYSRSVIRMIRPIKLKRAGHIARIGRDEKY
jgi:hypothetical protein